MNEIVVRDISVNRLFDWFDQRCLAVPEIQREFVWNAKRAVALLDSMYKGYPVGTVMVWRADRKQIWMLRHKLHILPPFDPTRNKEIFFLVDGQQRLSVLHQVRRGESIYNSNGREIRFGDIYFSVNGDEAPFQYLRRPDEETFRCQPNPFRPLAAFLPGPAEIQAGGNQELPGATLKYRLFILFYDTKRSCGHSAHLYAINAQGMRSPKRTRHSRGATRETPIAFVIFAKDCHLVAKAFGQGSLLDDSCIGAGFSILGGKRL